MGFFVCFKAHFVSIALKDPTKLDNGIIKKESSWVQITRVSHCPKFIWKCYSYTSKKRERYSWILDVVLPAL